MEKQILTARDVADALGHKDTSHVYALIRAGQLPAVKVGTRGVRIPRQAFQEYLDQLNASARASVSDSFTEAFAQAGSALAAVLKPTAEALSREAGAAKGFEMYFQNRSRRG